MRQLRLAHFLFVQKYLPTGLREKETIMKKVLSILLVVFALTLALASCGGEETTTTTTTQPIIPDEPPVHVHTEVIDPAVEATCTATGLTEGKHCSECAEIIISQTAIEALGHRESDWIIDKKPTLYETGEKHTECTRCGETISKEAIPILIPSEGLAFTLNSDQQSYSVTGIGTCTDTDIIIPSTYNDLSVTNIGNSAFGYRTSLTSIVIPDSVTNIGKWAFYDCTSLTSIEIPDSVTSIGNSAFDYCTSLTSIEIPDSVTSIGDSAFSYCTSLTSIEIPDSVTSIGGSAFSGCTSLTSIEVDTNNQNYKSIDGNLYSKDGTRLIKYAIGKTDTSFTIPDSVTSIGGGAFWGCDSLTSVDMGDSVKIIGGDAFSRCTSLTNIEIPDTVTSIGEDAFSGCNSLTSVTMGDSVKFIGGGAFSGCDSLTSIETGDSVTSIGNGAFSGCDSLTSVIMGNSVTSIGDGAFYNCTSLASIEVDTNNQNYKSIDGNLYSKDGTTLIQYAIGKTNTSFTIPNSVRIISNLAFSHCTFLTSIEIPDLVTRIGSFAFQNCTSLTSIEIPDSVRRIANQAFDGCTSLTIYCEAESQPSGWDSSWNNSICPVVWGYKGE